MIVAKRDAAMGAWPGGRVLVLSPTPTHPQDYGNRKRIFQVCSRYAAEGAHITFVHYPAESEWRGAVPMAAELAMKGAWHQYYTIPPTRNLHAQPEGYSHRIDEWWDDSIGQFLRWLFSVQSFDVFIVNYSWLSKAFEYVPPGTFKILDTHDKVSGRREMLNALGLGPEFFYTTENEEALALARADLVWAIKSEERDQFEYMSSTPVLTLPHLDPEKPLKRPAAARDGYLRVGVIGARNNVNRMNIAEFLRAAAPVFLETFAPVRIVVAGSVCDIIENADYPFVELRGRIEHVEDFYRSVDCIAVPMRMSTGLKIKTGEALSFGQPLISLAHAFEGYHPSHPLHGLKNFEEMAHAIADLSFAPRSKLTELAKASGVSHAATGALVEETFRESDRRARVGNRSAVLAMDSRAFPPGNVFHLALMAMQESLSKHANVTTLVVRGDAADVAANAQTVARLGRVVVADDVSGAEDARTALSAVGVEVFNAEEYLKRIRPMILLVDAPHSAFVKRLLPETTIVSRIELIAQARRDAEYKPPVRGYRKSLIAAPAMSLGVAALAGATGATIVLARSFESLRDIKLPAAPWAGDARRLAILGSPDSPAVRVAASMATAWKMRPYVVCGFGDRHPKDLENVSSPDEYIASILEGRLAPPHAAVDLSGGRVGLGLCREFLELLYVPMTTGVMVPPHRASRQTADPQRVSTETELWRAIRAFAEEPGEELQRKFVQAWKAGFHESHWLRRHAR
jgi:hypothetical protein